MDGEIDLPEGEPLLVERPPLLTRISLGIAGAAGGFVLHVAALAGLSLAVSPFAGPFREFKLPLLMVLVWILFGIAELIAAAAVLRWSDRSILRGAAIAMLFAGLLTILVAGTCSGGFGGRGR